MGVRVTDKDLGYKAILRELHTLAGLEASAGVFDPEIAQYAAYNEFGTSNMPSRPFMRIAFDKLKVKDQNVMGVKARTVADNFGKMGAQTIRDVIAGPNIPPPLKPSTVQAKGHSKTLIDTGAMLKSITHKVSKKK